ncbi:MAG: hypothetical protein NTW14_09895 [bacterium]|nr:hypothetical protein [bacterium]
MDAKKKIEIERLRRLRSEHDFEFENVPVEDGEDTIRLSIATDSDRLQRIRKRKMLTALRSERYKDD